MIELFLYKKLIKNFINLKELFLDISKPLKNIDLNNLSIDLSENLLTTKYIRLINTKSLLSRKNIIDFELLFLLKNLKINLVSEKLTLNLLDYL